MAISGRHLTIFGISALLVISGLAVMIPNRTAMEGNIADLQEADSNSVAQISTVVYVLTFPPNSPEFKEFDPSKGDSGLKEISSENFKEFIELVRNIPEAKIVTMPKVITADGESAFIRTNIAESDFAELNITNTISDDLETVLIEIDFNLSGKDGTSRVKTRVSVLSNHAAILGGGDGILMIVKPEILN